MSAAMTRQRYAHLDALRALAALAVMIEHMFGDLLRQAMIGPVSTFAQSVVQNLSLGRFGVALFFLISGFVVPFSIAGERPLRSFAISRLFRLYPAFWLALAGLILMARLSGDMPGTATVLANMAMAPPLFGQPWLSPIHWTLFVELLFYGLVALLFAAGALRQIRVVLGLGLALIAATVVPVQLRMHGIVSLPIQYLGMHLSFLFLGLLLRLWLVERMRGAWLAALVLTLGQVVALLVIAPFSLRRGDNFIMEGPRPVLAAYLLALAVFLAAVRSERPRSLLPARIGFTSYSMYLFHGVVNALVYRVLPLTGQLADLATMLVCTVLTLALSWLVYRTVERPMIGLGRRISERRNAPLAAPLQPADASHGPAGRGGPLAVPHAGSGAYPSDYRAVPPLSELAIAAAPEAAASDRLLGAVLGIAIAAVTLSWFALLGYVGWAIVESL
jgi:peptidoglycan/LPS O-acetylase OafA/YrhL